MVYVHVPGIGTRHTPFHGHPFTQYGTGAGALHAHDYMSYVEPAYAYPAGFSHGGYVEAIPASTQLGSLYGDNIRHHGHYKHHKSFFHPKNMLSTLSAAPTQVPSFYKH